LKKNYKRAWSGGLSKIKQNLIKNSKNRCFEKNTFM